MAYDWTEERIDFTTRSWREGKSALEIARQLGGLSRNAVLGKIYRLGLLGAARGVRAPASRPGPRRRIGQGQPSAPRQIAIKPGGRGEQAALANKLKALRERPPAVPQPFRPREATTPVASKPRRLAEFKSVHALCRWPLDLSISSPATADSLFCGAPTDDTECSFCPAHAKLAYTKQPSAKDRIQAAKLYERSLRKYVAA